MIPTDDVILHSEGVLAEASTSEMLKKDILPSLIQCFAPILIGYISGKTGLISSQDAKGLHIFVQYFSLPALIFASLATIKIEGIKWGFLACIFVAKASLFILVSALTMVLTNPIDIGKAGMYGLVATQSNDFALGYPLMKSLYSHHHINYPNYLYLVAPIQLAVINPIGLILLELCQQQEEENGHKIIFWSLMKRILSNPIILCTGAGIIGNYIFNHQLPDTVSQLFKVLGSAFPATALFLLGLTMAQEMKRSSFITIALLVAVKLLIMPLMIQKIVPQLIYGESKQDIQSLENFGFLYGIIPCAPAPFIFAKHYNIEVDVAAGSMVTSTFLSVPLIIASASTISLSNYGFGNLQHHLQQTVIYTSLISLICCVWLIVIFLVGRKWKMITHGTTMCLILAQLFTSIGGMLWLIVDPNASWTCYMQFVFSVGGIFAARIWTALLSLLLVIMHQRSLCFVLRIRFLIILLGFGLSVVLVVSLITGLLGKIPQKTNPDPNFPFGKTQAIVAFTVLLLSFTVTAISLIIQQRSLGQRNGYIPLNPSTDETINQNCSTQIQCNQQIQCDCGFSSTSKNCCDKQLLPPDMEDLGSFPICVSNGVQSQDLPSCSDVKFCIKGNVGTHLSNVEMPEPACFTEEGNEIKSKCGCLSNKPPSSDEEDCYPVFCSSNFQCSRQQRKHCEHLIHKYESTQGLQENTPKNKHQITNHVVLLLLMALSMIIGLAVCFWKLTTESRGIYIELEFLDVIMNYGQGIFTFAIFGIDPELIVAPIKRLCQKIHYRPNLSSSESDNQPTATKHTCEQFLTYHYEKCIQALAQDIHMGTQIYEQSFHGKSLVDWLLAVGLAHDRKNAEAYGTCLILGQIIEDVNQRMFFEDSMQVYRFIMS